MSIDNIDNLKIEQPNNLIDLLFKVNDLTIEELEQNWSKFLWEVYNRVGLYNNIGKKEMIPILKLIQEFIIGSPAFEEFDKKWNRNSAKELEKIIYEFNIDSTIEQLNLCNEANIINYKRLLENDIKNLNMRLEKLND